jgi:hypothetical protein
MALFLLSANLGWIQGQFNFYRTFVTLPRSPAPIASCHLIFEDIGARDATPITTREDGNMTSRGSTRESAKGDIGFLDFRRQRALVQSHFGVSYSLDQVRRIHHTPQISNPIEQIWRAIKQEIAATVIMNYEHLTATIAGAFKELAEKRSYREKRAARFLSPKYASKILCRWLYLRGCTKLWRRFLLEI